MLRHWKAAHPGRECASFRLWVDAICISQQDTAERSQQVQLMRRIYGSSDAVIAWLGPDDGDSAFATIKILAEELAYRQVDSSQGYEEGRPEITWMRRHPTLCQDGPRTPGNYIRNNA